MELSTTDDRFDSDCREVEAPPGGGRWSLVLRRWCYDHDLPDTCQCQEEPEEEAGD